jgi:LPXTG-motif cell wall-anchored protein
MRRRLRWVFAGTLVVLLPKCFVCVAGYLAVLTGLAFAMPELCGAGETGSSDWQAGAIAGLVLSVLGGGFFRLISQKDGRVSGNGGAKR